jgi:hypothetical protein
MYDARAVAFVRSIDRLITAKAKRASLELGALLNALTIHLEEGLGHPEIVRGFERLFIDIAQRRSVSPAVVDSARKHFHGLVQYLFQTTAGD